MLSGGRAPGRLPRLALAGLAAGALLLAAASLLRALARVGAPTPGIGDGAYAPAGDVAWTFGELVLPAAALTLLVGTLVDPPHLDVDRHAMRASVLVAAVALPTTASLHAVLPPQYAVAAPLAGHALVAVGLLTLAWPRTAARGPALVAAFLVTAQPVLAGGLVQLTLEGLPLTEAATAVAAVLAAAAFALCTAPRTPRTARR